MSRFFDRLRSRAAGGGPRWQRTSSYSDLHQVAEVGVRYDRDVIVAETQYPWTLANGDSTDNFVWTQSQLPDGYPASPGGQLRHFCVPL